MRKGSLYIGGVALTAFLSCATEEWQWSDLGNPLTPSSVVQNNEEWTIRSRMDESSCAAGNAAGGAGRGVSRHGGGAEPCQQEEEDWRKSLFEDALERLCADPQTDRQTVDVFNAYAIEGTAAAEVARRFGLKENAFYQIKNRMTRRLQREVEILMEIGEKFTVTDPAVCAERL